MMEPFSLRSRCPKCGGNMVFVDYVKARKRIGTTVAVDPDRERAEHLRRTCRLCRYGWNQQCLPAREERVEITCDEMSKEQVSAFIRGLVEEEVLGE
jgi:predicted nucleic-acid-binding Zn-ribbon protein